MSLKRMNPFVKDWSRKPKGRLYKRRMRAMKNIVRGMTKAEKKRLKKEHSQTIRITGFGGYPSVSDYFRMLGYLQPKIKNNKQPIP